MQPIYSCFFLLQVLLDPDFSVLPKWISDLLCCRLRWRFIWRWQRVKLKGAGENQVTQFIQYHWLEWSSDLLLLYFRQKLFM